MKQRFYSVIQSLFVLFLLVLVNSAGAQGGNLTGKLSDSKGTPVSFANVTLLKAADSSFAAGVITDSTGWFRLTTPAAGTYLLRFTAIGFAENRTAPFEAIGPEFSKNFGSITLKGDSKTLQEVSVESLRPTLTQLPDKLVVSVEGTAMAAGNTAFTVLSKSPGVFIDPEGNIQLNGRSGIMVMIDGRQSFLSARDLRTMLESMPAENLKNIEIITNPSSKYDAEGTSGILNLNLKKNTQQGLNGSVNTTYNNNFKQYGGTASTSIAYKKGRFNSYINSSIGRFVGGRDATFTRVFVGPSGSTYFDQVADGNYLQQGPPSVRLGSDYTINAKHSVGFMASYNTNTGKSDFLTDTYIGTQPKTPSSLVEADNYTTNTYSNFTTNLHYGGKLDTVGTTLSADLDYVHITNRGFSNFYNYFTNLGNSTKTQDFLYTNNPNGYDVYSGKIDYTRPLKGGQKLEAGGRISQVVSDNDNQFYFNNGSLVIDPARTNHFKYREAIYAAYANWTGTLSKKWSVQTGLRMERTFSEGNLLTTNQVTTRKYTNLFPTLFLQQKVSANYGINYSITRRINRPNYGFLNPFRAYRDPYTYYVGNPYLRPSYSNVVSMTHLIRKVYTVTLSYQRSEDVISELPILDVDNAVTVYTQGNISKSRSVGATAVAPLKIARKWDSQNTAVLSYNKFLLNTDSTNLVNAQLYFSLQSNHTILLPKALRMEVNLLLRGPGASGLYQMDGMTRVDIAFKRTFAKKKLEAAVNATDIFKGFRLRFKTNIDNNINDFDQYFRVRAISFSLRYIFSKGQKVEERKKATVDEVNRI
ncbi:MAG: TonB-dependent receptor [Flaviaesturariibacter sp.]|nr:TonB-dependent receptor [Flaviaesturariibacter sp.]